MRITGYRTLTTVQQWGRPVGDANGVWRSNFGFHHAVEYLYRERAIGFAWGTGAVMFPAFFTPRGSQLSVAAPGVAVRSARAVFEGGVHPMPAARIQPIDSVRCRSE